MPCPARSRRQALAPPSQGRYRPRAWLAETERRSGQFRSRAKNGTDSPRIKAVSLCECTRCLTLTENKESLYQLLCLSLLLCRSQQFLPRRQMVRRAVVVDLFYLFTSSELVEIVIQEQEPVAFLAGGGSRTTNPVQQFARHCLDLRMAINFLLTEHMPDRHQQLASNSHNCLLFANAPTQALKLGFPVGVMFDRNPGRLNHYPAQITAPLLGDAPTAIGFPG